MAPDLLSLELVLTLALLAPGFLTLLFVSRLRGSRRFLGSDLQNVILSLALSATIGLLLAGVLRLESVEEATAYGKENPYAAVGLLLLAVVVLTVVIGAILLADPVGRVVNLLYAGRDVTPVASELWDSFMKRFELRPVEVTMKGGDVFKGFLAGYSLEDETRALHISGARRVVHDPDAPDQAPAEYELGPDLLIPGDEIRQVLVLAGERGHVPSGGRKWFRRRASPRRRAE